jgi:hypothetical protein
MQRKMVILYRCFGTTYRFHLQGSNRMSLTAWPLRMGPIGCFETSARNYHSNLRKIPKESRSHLNCRGSLKSPTVQTSSWNAKNKESLLTRWSVCVTWKPQLSRTINGTTAWSWWSHTGLKHLHQCLFPKRSWPLLPSKNNHGSSHPCSRKYSVRIIGNQNLKITS